MSASVPLLLTVFGAVAGSACHESMVPTAPSSASVVAGRPAPPPTPAVMYTLSGVVSELSPTGLTPSKASSSIAIRAGGSATGHTFTSTDSTGFYRFAWTPAGVHPLQVWKEGYDVVDPLAILADGTAVTNAVVEHDTWLDIRVTHRRADGARGF